MIAFGTNIGKFYFKQLPYDLYFASEVFEKIVLSIISDIQGNANSQYDVIVWVKTLAEHDNGLRKVLLRVRESGLKLYKNKC